MNVSQAVFDLTTVAIQNEKIEESDRVYQQNNLLREVGERSMDTVDENHQPNVEEALAVLMEAAKNNGKINDLVNEDMMEALIMDAITPLPSHVNKKFWDLYKQGPSFATDYFFKLSKQNNYIKTKAIAKNIYYTAPSKYGELEITINLSKPEKDPKAIAAALKQKNSNYPLCALCIQNEGYFGSLNQAARTNHRIISLKMNNRDWGFQYSPYAYFNEHAIILNKEHTPMVVSRDSFVNLVDFVAQFPDYTIGSNADIPIVGGSILTHDHYQGGRHEFPMAKAELRSTFELKNFSDVKAGIVNWPMSVIRLRSANRDQIIDAAEMIRVKWNEYSNEKLSITAVDSEGQRRHSITPIMRMRDGEYELDLVLRDNNTSDQYPDGIFHPHKDVQHIKQENIGLIEVMGLAILPPRLKGEMQEVKDYLNGKVDKVNPIHQEWADEIKAKEFSDADSFVDQEMANVFARVLEDAGVFKDNADGQAGFDEFIATLNA